MPLERLQRYLARLPDGFNSYPQCQSKGEMLAVALDCEPELLKKIDELPEPVRLALSNRAAAEQKWVPTIWLMSAYAAVADLRGFSEPQFDAWSEVYCQKLLAGPLNLLFRVFSAGQLTKLAANRWSQFHLGTSMSSCAAPPQSGYSTAFTVTCPPRLYPPEFARLLRAFLLTVGRMSRAKFPRGAVTELADDHLVLSMSWNEGS